MNEPTWGPEWNSGATGLRWTGPEPTETPPNAVLAASEGSPSTRTPGSDHLGSCGHELDGWEIHLEHRPDCGRGLCVDDRCDCPEVCPDCCTACGYDLAERCGS